MRTRQRGALAFVAAVTVLAAVSGTPVEAHRSPSPCNANNLALNVSQDRMVVRNGDDISYLVTTSNLDAAGQAACDLTGVTVTLTLPARDGTPTGEKRVLAAGVDYPAGTPLAAVATVPYEVAVDPGVSAVVVKAEANGTLHDAPNDDMAAIVKTLSTAVTQPHATLRVTPEPKVGRVPLTVTYTYLLENDSPTGAPVADVKLAHDACPGVRLTGGDANANGVLDSGETWTFSCPRTLSSPGTVTSRATATGTSVVDGRPQPPATARVAVTATNPHTTLRVIPSPDTGRAPLTVTYTYTEANDGTDPIADVAVADDLCAPLTVTGGDGNGDAVLEPGETWTLACTRSFDTPGTFTNTVSATGTDTVDGLPAPPESAQATVTVLPPLPPPTVRSAPSAGRRDGGGLPLTGLAIAGLVVVALGLLGGGALLVGAARRRRQSPG